MCNCNMLHSNLNGYIAYCESCSRFQVAFDIFSINIHKEDFEKICSLVNETINCNVGAVDPDSKLFVFRFDSGSIRFHFSLSDLERLNSLLEPSRVMFQVYELTHE